MQQLLALCLAEAGAAVQRWPLCEEVVAALLLVPHRVMVLQRLSPLQVCDRVEGARS